MPGAQDRWDQLAEPSMRSQEGRSRLDHPQIPDRPGRGSLADLRRRLDRLPAGHPSSPYNDDLSRKPPIARLKDLELPLHLGERDTNGVTTQYRHDTADGTPVTERAEAARRNGSGGAEHAPGGPATTGGSVTDWSGSAGWSTGADIQPGPDGRLESDGALAADDEIRPDERADTDARVGADDWAGADGWATTHGAGGPIDADDPIGASRWSTADPLAVTDDGSGATEAVTADDWVAAEHEGSGADEAGTARWPGTDDLSNTAEWSRTPEWSRSSGSSSGRDGDDSVSAWNASGDDDRAASSAWLAPEPAIESGRRADHLQDRLADQPRTGPDGSWEWNGRYLTPDECQIAEEALNRNRTAEGRNVFGSYGHSGLTPAMRRLEAQLERGQLLPDTESYALKPPDQFKARLADLIQRHPDKSAEELSHEVHDGIRYACIFDAEHYADATLQVHSRLKGQGFELEVRRNSWRSPEYKGINTRWRDPAHDVVFEVQFHTGPSWDARQRAHATYRQIMDPATAPAERGRLRAAAAQMSAAVPVPPRCTAIPDYRKETL